MSRRAAFLDRDGVINRALVHAGKPRPPADVRELDILPGVREAIRRLRDAGYLSIVVTNQPDVARGATLKAAVEAINEKLKAELAFDAIYVCWHDDADHCDCRKPKPGLLLRAAREYGIDLAKSVTVGDRWKDVAAGKQAGCTTIWIDRGYTETRPHAPDHIAEDLPTAVSWILSHKRNIDEKRR